MSPEGGPLVLQTGENGVAFECDPATGARAKVTLWTKGEALQRVTTD